MAEYYPSEIARLVLGYLKEVNCLKTWEIFLVESIHLQEHKRLLQSGKWCSTNIEGKSLLEILTEYYRIKNPVKKNKRNKTYSTSANLNSTCPHSSSSNKHQNASFPETSKQGNQNSDVMPQNILGRDKTDSASFTDILSFDGKDGEKNKDEWVQAPIIATITSKPKAGTSKQHVNTQNKNCEKNLMNETFSHLSASTQVVILNGESTVNQNTPMAKNTEVPEPKQEDNDKTNLTQEFGSTNRCSQVSVTETIISETGSTKQRDTQEKNNEQDSLNAATSQLPALLQPSLSNESAINQNTPATATIEVPEPMQVDSDQTNLTQESDLKDVLVACMSIKQPKAEDQLQNCSFEQNKDAPNNVNDIHSTTLNINESSGLVPASVVENGTGLDDTSTLKLVSIGTPFQVPNQVFVPQSTFSANQSIPTTHTIVCYPPLSSTDNTTPFIQSERNIPILPAVNNKNFSLNSNFQTAPFLQFPYPSAPGIPIQLLNGFQSKIVVVQPCPAHSMNATNWTNNNFTNGAFPVQTASLVDVAQNSIMHSPSINVPHDNNPSRSLFSDNIRNFEAVTSAETAMPNENTDEMQSSKFSIQLSPARVQFPEKKIERLVKKQSLFPLAKDPDCPTRNDISDDILVIPHPSSNKDESISAAEILTSTTQNKITHNSFTVISSSEKGDRQNSTHEALLPIIVHVEAIPKQSNISTEDDSRRSSPSLNQEASYELSSHSPSKSAENSNTKKKAKRKQKPKEKVVVTADMVDSTIEKLSTHEAVSSSMSSVLLSAMQNALQVKHVKSKRQDSSAAFDFYQRASLSLSPIKKTSLKSSGKKTVVQQKQFFPNSLSDSDSDSDNIPLNDILVSKSKGNSLDNLTVLESDEDMEISETINENVASKPICNIEGKSHKKKHVENHKKEHHPKFTSHLKGKRLINKKQRKK